MEHFELINLTQMHDKFVFKKCLHARRYEILSYCAFLGTYAFKLPDSNEEGGMWVGYEDPDTAANKAGYVK